MTKARPGQVPGGRQPSLVPGQLTEAQQLLYERIIGGPRSGSSFALTDSDGALLGPFGGFLLSPAIGGALEQLGAAIRYRSNLPPRVRELAILVVATHHASAFERHAHEAAGRAAGLLEDEISSLADGRTPSLKDPVERAAVRFTRALIDGDVDDSTWDQSVPLLSLGSIYELIVLVGYYSTLALQMRVLRTDAAPS